MRREHTNAFISLRTAFGTYIRAVHNGGGSVDSISTSIGGWEKFELVTVDRNTCVRHGDRVSIRTTDKYYFSAQSDGSLTADRRALGGWETFTITNHTDQSGCLESGDKISLYNSDHGKYMVGDDLGGAYVNRDNQGAWEVFEVQYD